VVQLFYLCDVEEKISMPLFSVILDGAL